MFLAKHSLAPPPGLTACSAALAADRKARVRFDCDFSRVKRYAVWPLEAAARLCPDLADGSRQDQMRFFRDEDGEVHLYVDDGGSLHRNLMKAARAGGWTIAVSRRENALIEASASAHALLDPRPGFLRHAGLEEIGAGMGLDLLRQETALAAGEDASLPGPGQPGDDEEPGL